MRSEISFQGLTFPRHQIKTLQAAQSASLDMRTLEVDTVELTVKTGTELYGLVTADNYPLFTADGYRLCVSETFALTDWSQAAPVRLLRGGSQYALWYPRQVKQLAGDFYAISGTSPLGKLTQMEHRGGVYAGREAGGLIREICGDVAVYVSPIFERVPLYGYLPYVTPSGLTSAIKGSAKDNLLKVLFALNAALRVDANGVLRVENLSAEVSSVIDRGRIYRDGAGIVDDVPVTSVTVLEHQYIQGAAETTLFEGTTTAGQIVIFRDPCTDLTASGFSILSSGANWAELSAGTGTLSGVPYIHITREVTRAVSEADTANVVRIEDATLVGLTNSADVADRMAAYYAHRRRIEVDAVVEAERPGDVVDVYDPVARRMVQACIAKMSPLNLSGAMKAKLSALVGFTPWQTVPFEDVRELITEGEIWTAPDNLLPGTTVNLFLFGGGDGGLDGKPGGDTQSASRTVHFIRGETGTADLSAGAGAPGGQGGAPGSAGKLLRASVTIDPGDRVPISIGAGGAANGGRGGPTTWGDLSSEDGEVAPNGWIDPVTGDAFALPGVAGADGAKGGDGGSPGNNGAAGGNVGDYVGGAGGAPYVSDLSADSVRVGGGAGSGASGKSDGAPGSNGTFSVSHGGAVGTLTSAGAPGVDGADALPATGYGSGGNGGGAGSGAGAGGGSRYQLKAPLDITVSVDIFRVGALGGRPGKSSAGVQGCIVAFYRRPIS